MELLLVILALAFLSGVRSRHRQRLTPAWLVALLLTVAALGYLSQRVI